jgi:ABC-type transporter Mla maintaining outer membrane lipid asymmetry ATPase subunit MlaF
VSGSGHGGRGGPGETIGRMEAVVQTEGLTKFYGKRRGLEDLGLEIHAGEVFGYLGPNGAGKPNGRL